MSRTEYKVLRCRSIAELNDRISDYESRGWSLTGRADSFNDMHVRIICIDRDIDDTEEVTVPGQ